ncbi:hypothetical protein ACEUZ9_005461 [Paracoccus litorisediminis]|uniref:hypothetical protein n=1 Tax=Paracoccus litorisediminis TaxID=2006130 RepID=UPI003731D44D
MDQKILQLLENTGNLGLVEPEMVRDLCDGRYAMAKRLLFHWTIILGDFDDGLSYSDRWCFATQELALEALSQFPDCPPPGFEPNGWHRHPKTGRRRPDGDASREFVDA